MRQIDALAFLVLFAFAAPAAMAQEDPPSPQRVIVYVNRNLQITGQLALEDDDVITVRKPNGELESLAKARVMQMVRLVDPQPDQTGVVVMRDGTLREGVIVEDVFDHVLVEIEGIRAKLKRDTVSHVILQPTFQERYAQAKAALQPGMYDAHLALAQWLFDQRRYEMAKTELLELLDQTQIAEARQLLTLVEAQLALSVKPKSTDESDDLSSESESASTRRRSGPVHPADLTPTETVTRDDVNIIRVYEIDFDHPPKVTIAPDTVRTLIEKYGTSKLIPNSQTGHSAMFRAAADKPLDIVRLMFELKARDLYSQIKVNSEPYALNMFRQRVHDTWLISNCATSRCHGGPYAGDLFLHRRNYKDERVRYTNLLILNRLQLDPEWPLINYDKPEDSLIIQYALPRHSARKPHPVVENWKPALSSSNQRLKEDAIEWIMSMMQPRPEYPVQYDPPRLARKQEPDDPAGDTSRTPR